MIVSNNIWIVILALLPIAMYSLLTYRMIPKGYVSAHRARRYFVGGLLSTSLVSFFYFIFPDWGDPQSQNVFISYFIFAMIQVGILEESLKFVTFKWVSSERMSEKHDLPIAIMFYSMMSAIGFAIAENIFYLIHARTQLSQVPMITDKQISEYLWMLVKLRTISSVIVHMICGVIMGYFLAKSHRAKFAPVELTKNDEEHDNKRIYEWYLAFIGVFAAAIYHGIYDLNLMLPDNTYKTFFEYVIIVFGLIVGFVIIKDMIAQSKKIRRSLGSQLKNYKNETH